MKDQKPESISEKMQNVTKQATEKITSLLWDDNADPDKIAALAITGGLKPAEIEELEKSVDAAKIELSKCAKFDLVSIKKIAKDTKAIFDAADVTVQQAKEIRSSASWEYETAVSKLVEAKAAFVSLTSEVERGQVPRDKAPAPVIAILARAAAHSELRELELKAKQIRLAKPKIINQLELLESRITQLGGSTDEKVLSADGLVDELSIIKKRLKQIKTTVKENEKLYKLALVDFAAAEKKFQDTPDGFEI